MDPKIAVLLFALKLCGVHIMCFNAMPGYMIATHLQSVVDKRHHQMELLESFEHKIVIGYILLSVRLKCIMFCSMHPFAISCWQTTSLYRVVLKRWTRKIPTGYMLLSVCNGCSLICSIYPYWRIKYQVTKERVYWWNIAFLYGWYTSQD